MDLRDYYSIVRELLLSMYWHIFQLSMLWHSTLKKERNACAAALHQKTKGTIENLSDQQVYDLLELKWIRPLGDALHQLPQTEIATLTAKVVALAEKYATTYKGVVEQIQTTEQSLSALIDELTGNEFDMQGLAEFQQLLRGE